MKSDFLPAALIKNRLDQVMPLRRQRGCPGMNYKLAKASEFAASWIEAWNSHDLDRVLEHYSEDAVFSSPLVRTALKGNSDSIRGRAALLTYFSAALRKFPSLRFRLRAVYSGDEAVILLYDSVNGLVASEKMKLNEKGRIVRVWVYYGRVKQSNAEGTYNDVSIIPSREPY